MVDDERELQAWLESGEKEGEDSGDEVRSEKK